MHTVYEFGPFRLDAKARVLTRDGVATPLGARGVAVLAALVSHAGEYVERSVIVDAAWHGAVVEEANLTVQISAIRRVLARVPEGKQWIETLSRRGYRFVGPVVEINGSPSPPAGNLPAERDSFVGRDAELLSLAQQWLNGARLITLTGTGGSGKTRLARRHAWNSLERWAGGVFFCDLSDARSQDEICFAVASALAVQVTGQDPAALLGHAIAARGRCLLILDNFEQVASLAPATVGRWLESAALASFIVTSRERLHIAGETLFALEPLPLDTDAVELFRVRALAQRPEFGLDVDSIGVVKEIVRLVDGLPLAIELAAARVRVFSLAQIAERMADRFRVLVGARRATHRQTTMKAAIDWSWNLLTPWEQSALAMCSVFEGEFTLRAAEVVLDLSHWSDAPPVVDVIESLIDKSLLRISMPAIGGRQELDEPHFGTYISVHEYAAERLDALGLHARQSAEERHGRYYATFGSEESLEPSSGEEQIRHRRMYIALALDNLVAAFRRAAARDDLETMVPAYRAIWEVLEVRGPIAIAVELGAHLPQLTSEADDLLVAAHLVRAGALRLRGQTDVAGSLLDTIIALTSKRGDRQAEGLAQSLLGSVLRNSGRPTEAMVHYERALLLHREVGNRLGEARILSHMGNVYLDESRHDEAKAHYHSALEVHRAIGNVGDRYSPLSNLALVAMNTGDFDEARRLWSEALELARRAEDRRIEGLILGNLGYLSELGGRPQEALELSEAALVIHRQVGDRYHEGRVLDNVGDLRLALGDYEGAIRYMEESLRVAAEYGDRELEGVALAGLGCVYDRQQRLDRARDHLERAVEIFRSIPSRRLEGVALGSLAGVLARLGMLDEARATFASGAELLRETNDPLELGKLLCIQARAEIDAGRRDLATALVADVQRLADNLRSQGGSALSKVIDELRKLI